MGVYPPNTFPSPNRIVLKGRGRFEEGVVSGSQVFPGHLVMDDGSGGIKPHNVYGKAAEFFVALEQGLQGIGGATTPIGAFDAYAVGVQAQYYVAAKGDLLQVLLANGENASEGDMLTSKGDGTFAVLPDANAGGNLYETDAASTALSNTTTETVFDNGSYSIPAGFLQAGDLVRVRAQGVATATNSTDTLTSKLYIGGLAGTAICSTGAVDVADGDEFQIEAWLDFRTVGASGTMIANGNVSLGTPGTVTAKPFFLGSTSLDTTAALALAVSGKWSVASTSDSCRLDLMTVDIIRQSGLITPLAVVASALDNSGGSSGKSYSPADLVQCRVLR